MTQPAPYNTGAVQPVQKTNVLAIVALVGGIVGILFGFVSLVGVICGHISLRQIKVRGEGGRGMALTGTILGYVGLVFWVIYLIVMVALVVASAPYGS